MQVLGVTRTVAEIAANSLAAVKVFERYGIDYCCGGKRPLADACQEKGLDPAAVETELQVAMSGGASDSRDWNSAPLGELIQHIIERHHGFLRREMPGVAARLDKVYRVYNERYGETLPGLPDVFSALQAELESHMYKEEQILFPAIVRYEQAATSGEPPPGLPFGSMQNPVRMMEFEHDEAGAALARIREITGGYSAPDYACVTYRALISGLEELEQDLHLHIHLENNILFPRALALETEAR